MEFLQGKIYKSYNIQGKRKQMKKLFTVLFVVIITDIIIFTSCIKQCSSIANDTASSYNTELENNYKASKEFNTMVNNVSCVFKYDNELRNRGKELEKLFDKTWFPITREIRYADILNAKEYDNVTATCCKDNECIWILHNPKYEIPDNLIIHELCHAALSCVEIKSGDHTGEEWNYLCDYFESLGYNPLRDGYSYGIKAVY